MGAFVCLEKWDGFGTAFVLWGQNKENRDTKAPKTKNVTQASLPMLFRSPHGETILSAHLKLAEPDQVLFLVPQYLTLVCHVLISIADCCLPATQCKLECVSLCHSSGEEANGDLCPFNRFPSRWLYFIYNHNFQRFILSFFLSFCPHVFVNCVHFWHLRKHWNQRHRQS